MALENLFRRVFRRISSAIPTVARGEQERRVLDEAKRILADEVIGRKRVENELAETQDKFRLLVENSVAGIYIIQDSQFVYVNPKLEKIFGYAPGEIVGHVTPLDLTAPADHAKVLENVRLREGGEVDTISYEFMGLQKNGSMKEIEVHGTRSTFNGRPAILGTLTEIGQAKAAENAISESSLSLAASEERLRLALDASDVGIWDWNIATGALAWTSSVGKLFGMPMEDFDGQMNSFIRVLHLDDADRVGKAIDNSIRNGAPYAIDFRVVQPNGKIRWISAKGDVWRDAQGVAYRMMGNVVDNTDRIAAADELRDAKERAEEANRLKTAIFANMSHEIRTPMTAILGYADILMRRLKGTPSEQDAQVIYRGGTRLLHLLNSIIDLARIESGKVELQPKSHAVAETIERVAGLLQVLVSQKGIALHVNVPADLWVSTDEAAEEQILTNIVGNAIRFTERGGIEISAGARNGMAVIEVSDTGIGIDPAFLPHVFEEFRQESEGQGRKHEGSGLGLSITKKLVEKMDGTIEIRSRQGAGCTVILAFPLANPKPAKLMPPAAAGPAESFSPLHPSPRRKILVVEDDPYCGRLLVRLLTDLHTVVCCETAAAALVNARQTVFDLVLMDINLKGGDQDGVEVMRTLRGIESYQPVSFVAMTAYAMKGDRERFLAAGFDGYIAKPFETKVLLGVIEELTSPDFTRSVIP